jgi:hypothetical protein
LAFSDIRSDTIGSDGLEEELTQRMLLGYANPYPENRRFSVSCAYHRQWSRLKVSNMRRKDS